MYVCMYVCMYVRMYLSKRDELVPSEKYSSVLAFPVVHSRCSSEVTGVKKASYTSP